MSGPAWRIYYSEGYTVDSDECLASEVPTRGVQVILIRHGRKGVRKLRLAEYYLWSPTLNRWLEMPDAAAVIVRALQEPSVTVLAGEYIDETEHEKILIAADNDPDFQAIESGPPDKAWGR